MIASRIRLENGFCIGISDIPPHAEWDLARAIVITSYREAGGTADLAADEVDRYIKGVVITPEMSPDERLVIEMRYIRLVRCTTLVWWESPGRLALEVGTYHGDDPLSMLRKAIMLYQLWKANGVQLSWYNFQRLAPDEVDHVV